MRVVSERERERSGFPVWLTICHWFRVSHHKIQTLKLFLCLAHTLARNRHYVAPQASTKTMSFSLHASTSAVSSRVLTSSVASSNKRVAPARAAFSVRAADAGTSLILLFFLPLTKRDRRDDDDGIDRPRAQRRASLAIQSVRI